MEEKICCQQSITHKKQVAITNRNIGELRHLVCNGKWPRRPNHRWERLFLKVVQLEEVSGCFSQIFLQAKELDHTHKITWTYFKIITYFQKKKKKRYAS